MLKSPGLDVTVKSNRYSTRQHFHVENQHPFQPLSHYDRSLITIAHQSLIAFPKLEYKESTNSKQSIFSFVISDTENSVGCIRSSGKRQSSMLESIRRSDGGSLLKPRPIMEIEESGGGSFVDPKNQKDPPKYHRAEITVLHPVDNIGEVMARIIEQEGGKLISHQRIEPISSKHL